MKAKAFKPPASLAACADLLYKTRERRFLLQRQASALEEQEGLLREHLINNLPKSQASGISGRVANAKIETKQIVQVPDWPKFEKYIIKNAAKGSFALLQRRVNASAVEEIWAAGKKVPGCEPFTVKTVSVTKR